MDESNDLLACPFCGSAAEYYGLGEPDGCFIQCTGPTCMASSKMIFPEKTDPIPLLREAWNERAGAPERGATDGKAVGSSAWLDALREAFTEGYDKGFYDCQDMPKPGDVHRAWDESETRQNTLESASNVRMSHGASND